MRKTFSPKINWYYENAPDEECGFSTTRKRAVTLGRYLFPLPHFFFSEVALSMLIRVAASWAVAELCPSLLVAPHSPCWDLAAARARTSIPTPPCCCPPGKLPF